MNIRRLAFAFVILAALGLLGSGARAAASSTAPTAGITISTDHIPTVAHPLPVLRLAHQKPPARFVTRILRYVAPGSTKLVPLREIPFYAQYGIRAPEYLLGAFFEDHLAALVNTRTGDAEAYPTLGRQHLVSSGDVPSFLERSTSRARAILLRYHLLPRDGTRFAIRPAEALWAARTTGTGPAPEAAALAYVSIGRLVDGYAVTGTGSRALLGLDAAGHAEGFVRSWETGRTFTHVTETRSKQAIVKLITKQLTPVLKVARVTVTDVSTGYYDGNLHYLQPVYRFTARIHYLTSAPAVGPDDLVAGYVGIGKRFERLPVVFPSGGRQPSTASQGASPAAKSVRARERADPSVGMYVVRDAGSGFVSDANDFWAGISLFGSLFNHPLFKLPQYYWAEPFDYAFSKDAFVNGVNIALTEAHGDWWIFSTESDCCDAVDTSAVTGYGRTDIPYPGFGAAAGGNLDYWIIKACEVIPSPVDVSDWYDPWWNVFGGLHSVVGFRTESYIDDGMSFPYGWSLQLGAPVVASWIQDVRSDSIYQQGKGTVMHGTWKLFGRPSAIDACGQENDSAFDTAAIGRAGCLRIWWI